jgi:hypothetical protein
MFSFDILDKMKDKYHRHKLRGFWNAIDFEMNWLRGIHKAHKCANPQGEWVDPTMNATIASNKLPCPACSFFEGKMSGLQWAKNHMVEEVGGWFKWNERI